jgi:hypothetical protein
MTRIPLFGECQKRGPNNAHHLKRLTHHLDNPASFPSLGKLNSGFDSTPPPVTANTAAGEDTSGSGARAVIPERKVIEITCKPTHLIL